MNTKKQQIEKEALKLELQKLEEHRQSIYSLEKLRMSPVAKIAAILNFRTLERAEKMLSLYVGDLDNRIQDLTTKLENL